MGTLHIVGINLQHRLGVHTCLFGGCQVLVGHLRGGLLCTMLYQYTTCKSTCCLVVEHIFVEFIRGAMRNFVHNQRVVIHMLLFIGNDATIALALSTFAREGEVELVASNTIMQRNHIMVYTTVSLLVNIDIAYAYILMMCLLHAIEVE